MGQEWGRRRSDNQAYPKTRGKEALPTGLTIVRTPTKKKLCLVVIGDTDTELEHNIVYHTMMEQILEKYTGYRSGNDYVIYANSLLQRERIKNDILTLSEK